MEERERRLTLADTSIHHNAYGGCLTEEEMTDKFYHLIKIKQKVNASKFFLSFALEMLVRNPRINNFIIRSNS